MKSNRTFSMIKPDAMEAGNHIKILQKIIEAGYRISALKMIQLSKLKAQEFYAIHKERPFFDELVSFIIRSPILVMVLEKENAVEDFRDFIGDTTPNNAKNETIRKLFGTNVSENAIHGSDSDENANIEIAFHFSSKEIF